ncbi:mitochondrial inner membrane protein OXA1-like [Salvia hispanica]|uniref:mitochondrial inner membrane protein OXA1-like n=1 Tax=Salvia hispanica TaxID=49212 RepID=UPI0020091CB7|nr:mitochondrial inner membrane protein OXA1-like [Salvia hispanica]
MAYRRSIMARSKLFYQQHQRFSPSLSHISGSDREQLPAKTNPEMLSTFLISRNNAGNLRLMRSEVPAGYGLLSGNVSRLMHSEVPTGYGLIFHRNISKVPSEIEAPAEDLNGVIGVVADKAFEAAPMVNEMATAAADSISNMNIIGYMHSFTGLEWWASIAAVTLLLRILFVPFQVYRLQYFSHDGERRDNEFLSVAIFFHIEGAIEKKSEISKWLDKYGRFYVCGFRCSYIPAICVFFCVLDMVKNVPSFTTGGTLWFTDLTTPNRLELPILLALTFWVRMKLNPTQYLQIGELYMKSHEIAVRAVVLYLVAVAAGFPTAVYIPWITSNLFSIAYGAVMIHPRVQKLLGISLEIPHSARK